LPYPASLVKAAAAQRLTIEQINRTSAAEVVIYRRADGQRHVVAYQLLPDANAAQVDGSTAVTEVPATEVEGDPVVAVPSPAPSTVVYAAPTVVYASPSPLYCYYDSPYSYSWPWFGSVYYTGGFYRGARYYRGNGGFRHYSARPLYSHYSSGPAYRGFAGGPREYSSRGAPGVRRSGESSGRNYSRGHDDRRSGQRDGGGGRR
jgi:hypothetical protein